MSDSNSLSRRRFLQATGGAAGAAALAGCTGGGTETPTGSPTNTGGGGSPTSTPKPQKGGTMKMVNATMTSLDPVAVGDTASGVVAGQIYEGLMQYPNGEPMAEKLLATGYETSNDLKTYEFKLQEGVQFQNGMGELTASDVVYSWERLAASPNSVRSYFILDSLNIAHEKTGDGKYKPKSMQLQAKNKSTVQFTLGRAFHATLQMLAYGNFAIHPEGVVGDIQGYQGKVDYKTLANSKSFGTGPFKLEFWKKGDSAKVSKFGKFRRDGQPFLDAIQWAIIEKDQAAYQYSVNKNADILTIPTSQYNPSKVSVNRTKGAKEFGTYGPLESGKASGQKVNYLRVPTISTYYLAFSVPNTPRAVRQAAAYVLNREEVSQTVFKKRYPPAFHFTPPAIYPGGGEAYDKHVQNKYPYGIRETQIGEAKRVMEEAGYGPDKKYNLTINAYQSQTFVELVQGLRDKLASAHINISVEPTNFSTIIQKGQEGSLQAYTLGWIADWPAPDNFLQLLAPKYTNVDKLGGSALSYTNWDNVDSQYKRQASQAWKTIQNNLEPTEEAAQARAKAYVKIEEANWNEAMFINLVHGADERFWYDNLHVEPFGGMGPSRQTHYTTWKEQ